MKFQTKDYSRYNRISRHNKEAYFKKTTSFLSEADRNQFSNRSDGKQSNKADNFRFLPLKKLNEYNNTSKSNSKIEGIKDNWEIDDIDFNKNKENSNKFYNKTNNKNNKLASYCIEAGFKNVIQAMDEDKKNSKYLDLLNSNLPFKQTLNSLKDGQMKALTPENFTLKNINSFTMKTESDKNKSRKNSEKSTNGLEYKQSMPSAFKKGQNQLFDYENDKFKNVDNSNNSNTIDVNSDNNIIDINNLENEIIFKANNNIWKENILLKVDHEDLKNKINQAPFFDSSKPFK